MNIPNLINRLKMIIPNTNLKSVIPLINSYNSQDWKNYISYEKNTYTRNLIYRNNNFEMYLIYWDGKVVSTIHDHADNGCVFKVLSGELIENRYNISTNSLITSNTLNNKAVYIDNTIAYHSIENPIVTPSASLHIYSPPNYVTNII